MFLGVEQIAICMYLPRPSLPQMSNWGETETGALTPALGGGVGWGGGRSGPLVMAWPWHPETPTMQPPAPSSPASSGLSTQAGPPGKPPATP